MGLPCAKVVGFGSLLAILILFNSAVQLHLSLYSNGENGESDVTSLISPSLQKHIQKRDADEETRTSDGLFPLTATLLQPHITPSSTSSKEVPPTLTTTPSMQNDDEEETNLSTTQPKNYPHITDWSDVPDHLFIRHFYKGNFSYANPHLCSPERKRHLKLIILVTSAIGHFQHRQNVRLTWGHYGQRDDVQYAFVIGDGLLSQANESVKAAWAREQEIYGDIIVPNFVDTYRSLTLKSLHMLDWLTSYCSRAKYFLKTDDDMFLNIPGLLSLIRKIEKGDEKQPKIYGHVFSGHFPQRDVKHRHHLKFDVYPHNATYPNFTSGPAYLMRMELVRPLLNEALKLPFIPLEDVVITGFSAMNLNIPRVDVPGFINEMKNPVDLKACELMSVMAGMTDGSAVQMSYVWYNYLMGKAICVWRREEDNRITMTQDGSK